MSDRNKHHALFSPWVCHWHRWWRMSEIHHQLLRTSHYSSSAERSWSIIKSVPSPRYLLVSPSWTWDRLSLETHHHPSPGPSFPSHSPHTYFTTCLSQFLHVTLYWKYIRDSMQSRQCCYCYWTLDQLSKTSRGCQLDGECCSQVWGGIGYLFDNKGVEWGIVSSWWHATKYFSLLSSPESFRKKERDGDVRIHGTNTGRRTQTLGEKGDVLLLVERHVILDNYCESVNWTFRGISDCKERRTDTNKVFGWAPFWGEMMLRMPDWFPVGGWRAAAVIWASGCRKEEEWVLVGLSVI